MSKIVKSGKILTCRPYGAFSTDGIISQTWNRLKINYINILISIGMERAGLILHKKPNFYLIFVPYSWFTVIIVDPVYTSKKHNNLSAFSNHGSDIREGKYTGRNLPLSKEWQ